MGVSHKQAGALAWPNDHTKALEFERALDAAADADADEFVSFIHSADRRLFQIEELLAWPNCPKVDIESPLTFWLGYAAQSAATPPQAAPAPEPQETPWHLLATPNQLIDAFGTHTGMSAAWFNHVDSTPRLLAARVHKGQGGKNYREPFYNVMMVLAWLTDPKRRKGKRIQTDTAWRILKHKFNQVYLEYQDQAPDPDSPG